MAEDWREHAKEDPGKIAAVEACGECHIAEYQVWKKTPHATGFKTLHRKAVAEQIAAKLGFSLIKRESLCLSCHYTPILKGEQLRADSGVSCESCHGAGEDWIDVHNDYGGKGFDHANEAAEHRQLRIRSSREAGMRRPSDLYALAKACFSCHTVPHEALVNQGGHTTGSGNFELLAWSQGEIRHNFLNSFLTGDGTDNAERSVARQRLIYVVGRALDLEHSLRGMALASGPGVYAKAMGRRSRAAVAEMQAIAEAVDLPEAEEMLAAVRAVSVTPGQKSALGAAAERIETATRGLLTRVSASGLAGEKLAALDPLLAGRPNEPRLAARDGVTSGPPREGLGASQGVAIRPASGGSYGTVGQASCSACHGPQNGWWFEDAHALSAEPFLDREPRNVEIARLFGVSAAEMALGTSPCMQCHGTVVSGKESREVQDGVSCESCHGAASAFLEPHREGDKALGEERPGYVRALQLGMVELRRLPRRAETCSSCHYIVDPKLIATGHPSGAGFDLVAGMAKVRHWQRPLAPAETLLAAWRPILAARGPVPAKDPSLLAASTSVSGASVGPGVSGASVGPGVSGASVGPGASGASAGPGSSGASASPGLPSSRVVTGAKKRRVHPISEHGVRGPGSCSGCHEGQNAWWFEDRHYASADPFFAATARALSIARLYGLKSGEMSRGNQICMDCHGTVVAGKEKRTVQDGVSCESCHGPAEKYLEPHQEGDKALGERRPGYLAALDLGMVKLKDLPLRARSCVSCHRISEARLISAGHPAGEDFDFGRNMASIRHWERGPEDPANLAAAYAAALGRRGLPILSPRRQRQEGRPEGASAPRLLAPRPIDPAAPAPAARLGGIEIPPLPKIEPGRSVEELLLLLKERLELLYRALAADAGKQEERE